MGPPSCTGNFRTYFGGASILNRPLELGGPLGPFLLIPPSPAQPLLLSGLGQPLHCLMEWPGLGHSTSLCLSFPSLESPRAWKNGR